MKYRKTQISELGRKCITQLDFPIQNLTLNEHDCGVKRFFSSKYDNDK